MNKRIKTNYIVIHCSDTPVEMDIGAEEIRRWHTQERGWSDIGYHYVIRRSGLIEKGRDEDAVGSHVRGFNSNSIGVCMVGGRYGNNNFTSEQFKSLSSLVKILTEKYPDCEVLGHKDLAIGKDCPSFDVITWYQSTKGK
jgi:N-acetyl-anhydromuramyl-L-alanine amidase AmpD